MFINVLHLNELHFFFKYNMDAEYMYGFIAKLVWVLYVKSIANYSKTFTNIETTMK